MNKDEIILKSRKLLYLNIFGENQTAQYGSGFDYQGSKEYTTNDDIRHLNWRQIAKGGSISTKLFSDSKKYNIVLLYLASGSLNFGKKPKLELAIELITALSYATIKSDNRLTNINITSKNQIVIKEQDIDIVFNKISKLTPFGKLPNYNDIQRFVNSVIINRSIIFVISDFLEEINLDFLNSKHEINAIILRDKAEENLDYLGEYEFIDTNSQKAKNFTIDKKTQQRYKEYMKNLDNKLYNYFTKNKINYKKIYTLDNPIEKLVEMLRYYE